ncbi:hypothetical protein [Vreelandella venusta]|uniref:hypothetical protein n=1 Tax=Vreelandella venusta TaxID=44935 RepID=UPI0011729B1E|nr:hypothetical protein [Halomonas venusta]GEK52366.1 hypothetical protein HVE01_30870 [Halomonas venusta]
MGFQLNNSAAVATGSNVRQFNDGRTKASGFLNVYVPTKGGGKRKLGTIALRADKPIEKAIMDRLNSDPEAGIQALMDNIELNYQAWNEDDASNDLDF